MKKFILNQTNIFFLKFKFDFNVRTRETEQNQNYFFEKKCVILNFYNILL